MRILHVLTTIDPAGAGPVEAARLYAHAGRSNYRVEIAALDDENRWPNNWNVPVHALGHSQIYRRFSSQLVPWLRQNAPRFDAVVVHGVWGYHLVGVYQALRNHAVPYFVLLHGMLNPWFKRTHPVKDAKKRFAWAAITRRALSRAAGVLYLCKEERRLALSNFSIDSRSEVIVPLGTPRLTADPDSFFREYPSSVGKRILLFLGRICYMKGCDMLLDAFARSCKNIPNVQLVICGPDQDRWRKALERRSSKLGIQDRVTWTGPLYGTLKLPALAAAELFVLPSRCETFPIAVLEALASSTPVLVTRDINIYPAIEQDGAGLICDSNSESVAEALAAWFKKTGGDRLDYRSRARECHARHFDLEDAVDAHMGAIRAQIEICSEGELSRLSA